MARRSIIAWIAVVLIAALLFAGRIWIIPARFSNDPNEGWNAIMAVRAFGAGPLYPPPGALLGNNYPPLSFYVIGGLSRLFGDAIVVGRIVALLATIAVAGWVGMIARRLGAGGSAAVAALLLLGFAGTLLRPYLAMNDPQWLALAVMLGGVWLVMPAEAGAAPSPRQAAAAALICVLAGLIKQNLVAIPLAVTAWLMWHHRRAAATWVAAAVAALLVAALCCSALYGSAFFAGLLAAPRHYAWARMAAQGWPLLLIALPMVIACLPLLGARRGDHRIDFILLMLATSLPLGLVQQSGQGVDVNAYMEAIAALALAGGVAFERSRRALTAVLLGAPLAALLPGALGIERDEFTTRDQQSATWAIVQERIDRATGPVICGLPAFCYWAGRDMGLDIFLYGQRMLVLHDPRSLEQALASHRFALIELEADTPETGELPDPVEPLVARHYRLVATDDDGHRLFAPD